MKIKQIPYKETPPPKTFEIQLTDAERQALRRECEILSKALDYRILVKAPLVTQILTQVASP